MLRPILAVAALLPLQAAAQEAGNRFAFTLRGGVEARPDYFGSDELSAGPDFGFDLRGLRVGALSFGDPDTDAIPEGLGFRGSFRYLSERSSGDHNELEGLDDVDAAFELGAGVSYGGGWYEAFAVARYGLTGHESLVADLGLDFVTRPTDRLVLRAGPRVFLGSDDFAATYFGVTGEEAAASGLPSYEAGGGVLSAGLEASVEYRLTDLWGVEAGLRYERLTGDAADSPITAEDNQLSAFAGVTRRFDIRF